MLEAVVKPVSRHHRIRIQLLAVTGVAILTCPIYARPGRPIAEIVQDAEIGAGRVSTICWNCEYVRGQIKDGAFVPKPWSSVVSHVQIESTTGRCRIEYENFFRVGNAGDNDFQGMRWAIAFNGNQALVYQRSVNRAEITGKLPVVVDTGVRPTVAQIEADLKGKHVQGTLTGIAYVLDNSFAGSLSAIAAEAKNKKLQLTTDASPDGRYDYVLIVKEDGWGRRIFFDRERQCVTGYEFVNPKKNNEIIEQCNYEMVRVDGIWLPKFVTRENLADHRMDRLIFSNWRVNQPIPEDRFSFTFPPETRVTDHVRKVEYRVGKTPMDEAAAIQAYLNSQGLHETTITPWYRRRTFFMATAALLAILGMIVLIRCRMAKAVVLVFGVLVIQPSPVAAEDKPVHKSACGFHVTIATLGIHGRKYDANKISAQLMKDSDHGISAKAIMDVLVEHDLEVAARTDVNKTEVVSLVRKGWTAIVATDGEDPCFQLYPQMHHYVVLHNHPQRGPVVLDILKPAVALEKSGVGDGSFSRKDLATLFVRKKQ